MEIFGVFVLIVGGIVGFLRYQDEKIIPELDLILGNIDQHKTV